MKKTFQSEKDYKKLQVRIWGIAILVMMVIYFLTSALHKGITMNGTEDALAVKYGTDKSFEIVYDHIEGLELRDEETDGTALEDAVDSKGIHYGSYENDEFGTYTAAYDDSIPLWIVITSSDGIYVINFENEDSTSELYSQLEKITGISEEEQTEAAETEKE